ncbi:MAG: trimethylamine corrinoid protein 2 [Defluviitaleaceae bacterium]|nr:trimethylamine corrinoid protein 2 [Defluviitaleaceae bacterium]
MLSNMYKKDWSETKAKWDAYWKRENTGRPLMFLVGKRDERLQLPQAVDINDSYMNGSGKVARYRKYCENHEFLAESFPNLTLDFGPGSMAAYLGCNPVFQPRTVWYEECVDDWLIYKDIVYDPDNEWFRKHIQVYQEAKKHAGDDIILALPDIIENVDILSSMRGAQNLLFDLIDEPEEMQRRIQQIDNIFFNYYDAFYDIAQLGGGSSHTLFQIWGQGKTAKLQCDFSAMMSPDMFREFIQPSLRTQAKKLDNVLYHLDGPDAICHLDALMEIEEIDSLQWTSGDYNPDGTFEEWYPIYDKAVAAGKALWIKVYTGEHEEQLKRVDRLIDRYGTSGMFLFFSPMPIAQANHLLEYAERSWR